MCLSLWFAFFDRLLLCQHLWYMGGECESWEHMFPRVWGSLREGLTLRRVNCECFWLSFKCCTSCLITTVCKNLCHVYFLGCGIDANFGIWWNPMDFSSMVISLDPRTLNLLLWDGLGQSRPFWLMRDLRMQWSHAFGLMCEMSSIVLSLESTINPSSGQHVKYTSCVIMVN